MFTRRKQDIMAPEIGAGEDQAIVGRESLKAQALRRLGVLQKAVWAMRREEVSLLREERRDAGD